MPVYVGVFDDDRLCAHFRIGQIRTEIPYLVQGLAIAENTRSPANFFMQGFS